ncbi:MAG TPA: ABC transporter permease subunit [Clostridia bacterium]|jgi:putative aldouronate transport system permease protein|nr:ABC transporter permease subunit [Clostridia bacterium]
MSKIVKKKYHLHEQVPLFLLLLPAIVHVCIFGYGPIYGLQIAFKNFRATKGIWGSAWVGLKHFQRFLTYPNFLPMVHNTITITLYSLALFPIPIFCALIVNEIRNNRLKKAVQTITYAPHFISTVVLCSMVILFLNRSNGLINNIIEALGGTRVDFMGTASMFPHIYVLSGVWQHTGWNMIVYLAALSSVSMDCVEAAKIDGANRMQVIWHVNLPHILPTIVILFVLRSGSLLSVGHEKVLLLQNPLNLETSTVISSYVYEIGLVSAQFSYSAAIGLFNTVVNLFMMIIVNYISRRLSQISLW